jgi:FhuF-like iron-sulfur protein
VTGWATTAELAGPKLDDALAACGRALRTDRADIQGQRLIEVVAWRLAVPVATALIEGRPLPDLRPDAVELWIGDEPPDGNGLRRLDDATHDGAPDEQLNAHLTPLIAAVNQATKRPQTALWRAAKDRQDGAVAWIAETTGRPWRALALLQHRAHVRMLDLGTREQLLHVREGCCLYYRTPANVKCFSCPLLDDDERRRLSGVPS